MADEFTPGPWSFKDDQSRRFVIKAFHGSVAYTCITPLSIKRAEGEANARLIASAPELLEALEGLLECAFDGPAYEAAIAALAKARGQ